MKFVRIPEEVSAKAIRDNESCFAPSKYVQLIRPRPSAASHFESLDQLAQVRDQDINVKKGDYYQYAEIGDIDIHTGAITFRKLRGYQLPTLKPAVAKKGDVLISTVRTYRGGIGLVTSDEPNLVTTNAVLNLCGVTDAIPNLTIEYVYSFLRSDFFIEQLGSIINRGVYPRMDRGALDKLFIPVPNDPDIIKYITALVRTIVELERAIKARWQQTVTCLHSEITASYDPSAFHYAYPTSSGIRLADRMDAGFWSKFLRERLHVISSYHLESIPKPAHYKAGIVVDTNT